MRAAVSAAFIVVLSACAHPPRATPVRAQAEAQFAVIDRLIAAGCYDCLVDALAKARDLAAVSSDPAAATRVRDAAGLLAIRERDLGLIDQHYLEMLTSEVEGDRLLGQVIATLPRRSAGTPRTASDDDLNATMTAYRNRDAWSAKLLDSADTSPLAAVAAVSFACRYRRDDTAHALDAVLEHVPSWRDTPLLRFTTATCADTDAARLSALGNADPRFREIEYFLGLAATRKGDLDDADRRFQRAFDWRQDWPAVTLAIADVAMTAEEFDRANDFYDRALALVPGSPDALFGSVRALSYGGHSASAIERADRLLAGHWYTGDAHYWRAWNEAQLNQNERAWTDVVEAAKLVFDANVPKLTGILALRRDEPERARSEFEQAHARAPDDCETAGLLGATELNLHRWQSAIRVLQDAATCLDKHDDELRAEIERLRNKPGREHNIARREQEVAADGRLRAQAWFNLAVASFNIGDMANARMYAERVAADEEFGKRARQLLNRLP